VTSKILIADDDAITRLLLKGVLQNLGYEVCEAPSGQAAWEHLLLPDAARLVILDWVMPGMSGPELCRRIKARAHGKQPYIILLTSKTERRDVVEGLDSGADDFIPKPCDHDVLRARIAVGLRIVNLQDQVWEANGRLEQRIRERTREVEQLLRQTEDLLHHLSHDLKTPLTPLLSVLPLLIETEPEPKRRDMLALAAENARAVHVLAAKALAYCETVSAAPALGSEEVDLRMLVDAALADCRRTHLIGERVLRNEVPADCRARAAPGQLHRVLANLLDNAVKFTNGKGTIVVGAAASDSGVRVGIVDDGIGLSPVQLERVFEPFYKGDPSRHDRSAVGLGLSIAKALVERLGGHIRAESAGPGQGAAFYFTLPDSAQSKESFP
jgi:two-component system, sensor histidine kinase and response regulator